MTEAPKRIWADADGYWNGFDPSEIRTVIGEYILATPEALAASPEVSTLLAEALLAQRKMFDAEVAKLVADAEARFKEAVRWGFLSAAPGEWRVSDIKRVTEAIEAAAIRKGEKPLTDYERKVAQMREDFPNGI